MAGGRQKIAMREFLRSLLEKQVDLIVHKNGKEKIVTGILKTRDSGMNPGYYIDRTQFPVLGIRRDTNLRTVHFYPDKIKVPYRWRILN
ncbi:hypothetical protein HYT25_00505 [Candidatus Pacearchaeota archaeon]|nr:hypothetical protein [Candidatus Pacearchaeota archaeon]